MANHLHWPNVVYGCPHACPLHDWAMKRAEVGCPPRVTIDIRAIKLPPVTIFEHILRIFLLLMDVNNCILAHQASLQHCPDFKMQKLLVTFFISKNIHMKFFWDTVSLRKYSIMGLCSMKYWFFYLNSVSNFCILYY